MASSPASRFTRVEIVTMRPMLAVSGARHDGVEISGKIGKV